MKQYNKALAAAIGVVLVWIASLFGFEIPGPVEAAIVTIIVFYAPANERTAQELPNDVV